MVTTKFLQISHKLGDDVAASVRIDDNISFTLAVEYKSRNIRKNSYSAKV